MRKIIKLFLIVITTASCITDPHSSLDPKYYIVNKTTSELLFRSHNLGLMDASFTQIKPEELVNTGGGGILGVDSVQFVHVDLADTIWFRNHFNGGDTNNPNHFFNGINWEKIGKRSFQYTLTNEDFE
ncbi:hypothetical protein OO013_07225 [Mangrovivirga sp. M17]|uniref:Uncharacterized protein n=1 Tax=Mangrovivirga halotolerans TaxID=2993936 RepID=A0ABT3RQJ6_9BACT|nr:hypothetical protein [Mangrovivirga halotolerans]MCX2743649.1 hypothetical protein [Mangrovivirga halotolerans]